ncbi:DUF1120 domain-containing protein [Enterobacter mori]|uniref:DUF1120 domain-containing protein n=1 Tax=Enterobacter mori TaxID=539813 RepID=UPI001B8D9785|nr:DUF1120 domain-containing protein [Enterobacter mori]MBS3046407.1 DUF1120 domain-containing protein [Enterobacter mori]
MKMKSMSALILLALVNGSALAATTADITVTGTIKPTACNLSLNGASDASVDYGVIAPSILSDSAITPLSVKTVPLKVICDAATTVAINAIDNKAATNPITGAVNASDAGEESTLQAAMLYGLGNNGSGNIGAYSLAMDYKSAKVDGVTAYLAGSQDAGAKWYKSVYGVIGKGSNGSATFWRTWVATAASETPMTGTTFEANLLVKAFIDKKSNLNLSGDVALNGSATVEIRYL